MIARKSSSQPYTVSQNKPASTQIIKLNPIRQRRLATSGFDRTDEQVPQVSKIRERARALELILPKFLGVLWRGVPCPEGPPSSDDTRLRVGDYVVQIGSDLTIGGSYLGSIAYMIHAYIRPPGEDWKKIFSAHVADGVFTDKSFFRYWEGRCAILSWKRGTWEDRLLAESDEPRTLAHVQTAGLSRGKARLAINARRLRPRFA